MRRCATLIYLGVILMGGCSDDDNDGGGGGGGGGDVTYDPYYYDAAYYDPYWYGYDAALAYTWVDPWGITYALVNGQAQTAPFDLPALATEVADLTNTRLASLGCGTAVASGQTVTMTFTDCVGPLGLASVNGGLTIALSENDDGQLVILSTSDDLEIDGAPFIIDSETTLVRAEAQREVSIVSHSRDPSRVDSRDAQFTVTWQQGSGCVEVNGESTTTQGSKSTTSTLDGYKRCLGECPSAGTITVKGAGDEFTGTFDGTDQFVVDFPNDDSKTYQLQCM